MLKPNEDYKSYQPGDVAPSRSQETFLDLSFVFGLMSRQKYLIAGCIALFASAGLLFAWLTPPSFRASSQIVIDPRRLDLFQKDSLFTGAPVDVGTIESQVQLIGSERIASKVIDDLNLARDPEFNSQEPSTAMEVVKDWVGIGDQGRAEARASRQALLESFQKRLDVKRVGLSYVIEISFVTLNPAKSARIANAVADTFIEDVIAGRLGAMQRAGAWLETRLDELGQRALAAEQALNNFKVQPNTLGASEMLAKVRELESNVSTYRVIYDNFLQRYMQTVQQQSFPSVEARVAAMANPPTEKSAPRTTLILAMMLAAGAALGTLTAAAREMLDGTVRTGDQLAAAAGTVCLGLLPELQVREPKRRRWFDRRIEIEQPDRKFKTDGVLAVVGSARFSRFSETIRSVKIAVDLMHPNRNCRIIGISSCLPSEGKSTIAANFAQLAATAGARVLLIDADLRNPRLSLTLSHDPALSLVEVVADPALFPQAIWEHMDLPQLHFLPGRTGDSVSDSFDVLGGPGLQTLLSAQSTRYDYIVLDFAPIAPVVDVRAALNAIDGMLLVARWGATSTKIIDRTIRASDNLSEKLIGAVLNRVDMKRLRKYDNLDSSYYSNAYYLRYRNVRESEAA
ncbi:MAG TPA: Wzz/FepE/Etk N-terminal domain-containing protein [Bosea sp. (in: a-proteobacteria)]